MQHARCTNSINSAKTIEESQPILENINGLQNQALEASSHDFPPSNIEFELIPDAEASDEKAALTAHLWHRAHAPALAAHERICNDLIAEVSSEASNEVLPILARRDYLEQGSWRDRPSYTEKLKQWRSSGWGRSAVSGENDLIAEVSSEASNELLPILARRDYLERGSWRDRPTYAEKLKQWRSSGWGRSAVSGELWRAEEDWFGCVRDDGAVWTGPDSARTHAKDIVDGGGSAETDGSSTKRSPQTQFSQPGPLDRSNTPNQASNASIIRPFSNSTSIPPSPPSFQFFRPAPRPQKSTLTPVRLRDPAPVPAQESPSYSKPDPVLDDTEVLNMNTFLDICIAKTKALLAAGENALSSAVVAELEESSDFHSMSEPDNGDKRISSDNENKIEEEEEEEQQYPLPHTHTNSSNIIPTLPKSDLLLQASVASERPKNKINAIPPKEIVRVERWWKIKGGYTWSEVGGWVEENGYAS